MVNHMLPPRKAVAVSQGLERNPYKIQSLQYNSWECRRTSVLLERARTLGSVGLGGEVVP